MGHTIEIVLGFFGSPNAGSVTDSLGNTYTKKVDQPNCGGCGNSGMQMWICTSSLSTGADTITITNAAQTWNVVLLEYTGSGGTVAANSNAGSATPQSVTVTAPANSLAVLAVNSQDATSGWAAAGFTQRASMTYPGATNNTTVVWDQTAVSGSFTGTATWTSGSDGIEIGMVATGFTTGRSRSYIF